MENQIAQQLPDEIGIAWHYADVQEVRPDLTAQEAREVLQVVKHDHDANYGICWDTLKITADDLYPSEES